MSWLGERMTKKVEEKYGENSSEAAEWKVLHGKYMKDVRNRQKRGDAVDPVKRAAYEKEHNEWREKVYGKAKAITQRVKENANTASQVYHEKGG